MVLKFACELIFEAALSDIAKSQPSPNTGPRSGLPVIAPP